MANVKIAVRSHSSARELVRPVGLFGPLSMEKQNFPLMIEQQPLHPPNYVTRRGRLNYIIACRHETGQMTNLILNDGWQSRRSRD
jgi:hypothetical protein